LHHSSTSARKTVTEQVGSCRYHKKNQQTSVKKMNGAEQRSSGQDASVSRVEPSGHR